jgi:Uma2 family endonuclease
LTTTPLLIPVEEYLNTTYHPDRDYIDGETQERNMGETPHGKLQVFLGWYFTNHRDEWRVEAITEQRVQITSSRFRIPDVCLISYDAPDELIVSTPPVLCIEILSRDDSMTEILQRVEDYLTLGVPAVWVVDPWRQRAYSIDPTGTLHPEPELLRVPNTPIQVPTPELFRELTRRNP